MVAFSDHLWGFVQAIIFHGTVAILYRLVFCQQQHARTSEKKTATTCSKQGVFERLTGLL